MVLGSPLNALLVKPPFREYHLIDLDGNRIEGLRRVIGDRKDVFLRKGNCNEVLLNEVFPRARRDDFSSGGYKRGLCLLDPYGLTLDWSVILETVFPKVRYEKYRRALCVLDPYGLHLNWKVIETAGKSRAIEIFLNFPVADINRNVLWNDPTRVSTEQAARLTMFWGDESWRKVAYEATDPDLFGNVDIEKVSNEKFAQAFRKRLIDVAGFKRDPYPLQMRNSKGSIVYYLFFASQKDTAENIVSYIFDKFGRGTI